KLCGLLAVTLLCILNSLTPTLRAAESTAAKSANPPTFTRDVAPILFEHCATCHRKGQEAPFSLLTYAEASKHARDIARVTESHYMPPWLPAAGYGDFRNNRSLSPQQISIFAQWYKAGSPEGNLRDMPQGPAFAEGWRLGTPDLVVKAPEPLKVPAE